MKYPLPAFTYERLLAPEGYACDECHVHGVKLWRDYNTFLSHQTLTCFDCTVKGHKHPAYESEAWSVEMPTSQLCGKVPAVPTEEGDTYWGYSSVPEAGCRWWFSLPPEIYSVVQEENPVYGHPVQFEDA